MTLRHFINSTDLSADDLHKVLQLSSISIESLGRPLAGLGAALIFEKPSNRTRHSMEMAVVQLGGHPVYTRGEEVGLDVRETVEDITKVMGGYHAILAARVFDHNIVRRMANISIVPVVNMLSDRQHPLQGLADVLTMQQQLGDLAGKTVCYVGDYNNVARSLAQTSALLGMHVRLGCPNGYQAEDGELEALQKLGAASVEQFDNIHEAVKGSHAVHTDVWTSMGQESETNKREKAFASFQVTESVMKDAAADAIFMHCLPAHRGMEVSAEVIDGSQSKVIEQAHNRMHAARGLLAFFDGGKRMTTKVQRQQSITRLISERDVTSQPQLLRLLKKSGIAATQATVSRDLEDLGAVKVRTAKGDTAYAIPEFEPERIAPLEQLRRVLSEWVADIQVSHPLVIVRTPPGCAHVVASALDRSRIEGLVGTVAGDDTMFCVASEKFGAKKLAAHLGKLAGLQTTGATRK